MKRVLLTMLAATAVAIMPASAGAHSPWEGDGGGSGSPMLAVAGTVVSVDATNGTFVADAFVLPGSAGGDQRGSGGLGDGSDSVGDGGAFFGESGDGPRPAPTATQVTITTDSATKVNVNRHDGTLADLSAGDKFYALFNGTPGDTLDTLVATPAVAVLAKTAPKPHQLYAFVGSVSAVDPTGGSVTVNVTRSLPSDLVPAGSDPVAFTVSDATLVLGAGSSGGLFGGSLSDVSVGDVVAGGLIGDSGLTLGQVSSMPLRVLLDLPASTSTSGHVLTPVAAARAKARVLKRAVSLLDHKSTHKVRHHRKHKKSHVRGHKNSPVGGHARRA